MPSQEEHDKPENLVEEPGEAERAARSLAQAANSNSTLQGYYAVNNTREDGKAPSGDAKNQQDKTD